MSIAITSTGDTLKSEVCSRFGRTPFLIVIDNDEHRVVSNDAATSMGGAGISTAQSICDAGVDTLIAVNVGPKAWRVLEAAGIKVYKAIEGSVEENVVAFREGRLQCLMAANVPAKH